ncbi:MAG: hypothetical protein OXI05_03590 [Bacteroidota bacterium]|nr:hypothetical protein [Bacteroidota bacterium]
MRKWIGRGDGVVVYSTYGKYGKELGKRGKVHELIRSLVDNGKAIDIDSTDVEAALNRIPDNPLRKSDDPHILALAIAGMATVLFSRDDDLCKDFANARVIPKIGRQGRRSVPGLDDKFPDDVTKAGKRKKILDKRRCFFC